HTFYLGGIINVTNLLTNFEGDDWIGHPDRGKLKWQPALMMPEHGFLLRELERDELRQAKPVFDEYELEEFERLICETMEFNQAVIITVWTDGYTYEEKGHVHYLDPIRKEVRMVAEDGAALRIPFEEITGVSIVR
ncbi:YolD-like family protein, partial [Enterococcus faecium]|uniref:YolD-like family protein n=1 Tax=Enterococcus faecium TaxID=1352 RepID=UPI0030C85A62